MDTDERTPSINTKLNINGVNVAQSFVFDEEEPTNVSLFYEGRVNEGDDVRLTIKSGPAQFFDINTRNL